MKINYKKVSNNQRVVYLIQEWERLEKMINELDSEALIKYELEKLSL